MLHSEAETRQDGPTLRVLVVDDNTDAADSLGLLVRLWGHDARVAYDGAGVLETAAAYRPDAILLDIGLPRVDGYSLARQLRQRPDLGGIRLIAVTGYADPEHRARSTEAGFDHYLVKPVDPAELEALLRTLRPAAAEPDLARKDTILLTDTHHNIVLEIKEAVEKVKAMMRKSP
jgi:CheY-like chemotaxis protein